MQEVSGGSVVFLAAELERGRGWRGSPMQQDIDPHISERSVLLSAQNRCRNPAVSNVGGAMPWI